MAAGPSSGSLEQSSTVLKGIIDSVRERYRDEDDYFLAVYEEKLNIICEAHRLSSRIRRYNYVLRIPFDHAQLIGHVRQVVSAQLPQAFRLNISFGAIFRYVGNVEFEQQEQDLTDAGLDPVSPLAADYYIYHYASENTNLFSEPLAVLNQADVESIATSKLDTSTLMDSVAQQRRTTAYVLDALTNVHIKIFQMPSVVFGCAQLNTTELPAYLRHSPNILCLARRPNGEPYNDNLCFFRSVPFDW